MGHSLSWLAVENAKADSTRTRLGLEITKDAAEPGEAPLVGCALPGGWYVIAARGCDHELISDVIVRAASADGTAVACSIEEHVMFSSASAWTGGGERWRVSHTGDTEIRSLTVTGEPPAELAPIRDECVAKQDAERADDRLGVDWFFEIPLLLAKGIVGFKHDEELPAGLEHGFVALRLVDGGPLAPVRSGEGAQPSSGHRSGRRPWWRFW
jgi:hypothetical protein